MDRGRKECTSCFSHVILASSTAMHAWSASLRRLTCMTNNVFRVLDCDRTKTPLVPSKVRTRGVELLLLPVHVQQPRAVRVERSTCVCTRLALALHGAGARVRRDVWAGEEDCGARVCLADVQPVGGYGHDSATAPQGTQC